MKRRKFLAIAGGGIILAAGASIGTIASRFPHKALEPWSKAGSGYTEPRMRALSYAILAPNPHNQQPWMVDLSKADQITLKIDTDRLLPHTDPYSRQITIGQGCFLEILRMAAAEDGYRVDFNLFPEGSDNTNLDDRPVAIISFTKDPSVSPDPLFAHVFDRRSTKDPFDTTKEVATSALERIASSVQNNSQISTNNEPSHVQKLREFSHAAMAVEIDTPRTYKESVDLFRIGKAEIEANPDGIDFSGPFFELAHTTGFMTREGVLDRTSTQFAEGLKAVYSTTDTAMAHLWQITQGNTREDQINAGRDWVRLNLAVTAEGLAIQPLSQALQEYPEMEAHYKQVHKDLAPNGGTIQMLARLGYAKRVEQSPRWPLEAKIIEA
ncbi:Acg family FMN-binding oxidoreductase [Lentilitoribacter sp. EG35]|uniref:Acg family FMN-binding oxidoreductase n=1 Tax=Lentilitoribacter sp. EG35 TaxID=3234192 RepID=UPI00345FC3E6